ncbi:TetR/AcrR family transcriptional regulator [Propionibacteriaceae bacterium G1746]
MSRSSYHHGDLAHALEVAAMELLDEQPAQAISLREVARRAGVSHNAPYHHFGDRTQLLKVLAERSMADLLARQLRVADAHPDPRAGARAVAEDYVDFALTRPHAFAAIYDPTICVPGRPTETMAPLIAREEQLVAEIARALHPTYSPDQVEASASAMWGAAHGIAELGRAGHLTREQCMASIAVLFG